MELFIPEGALSADSAGNLGPEVAANIYQAFQAIFAMARFKSLHIATLRLAKASL
jgi:hypothetical protein